MGFFNWLTSPSEEDIKKAKASKLLQKQWQKKEQEKAEMIVKKTEELIDLDVNNYVDSKKVIKYKSTRNSLLRGLIKLQKNDAYEGHLKHEINNTNKINELMHSNKKPVKYQNLEERISSQIDKNVNLRIQEIEARIQNENEKFKNTWIAKRKKAEAKSNKKNLPLFLISVSLPNPSIRKTLDKRWGKEKLREWKKQTKQNKLYKKWDANRNALIEIKSLKDEAKDFNVHYPSSPIKNTGDTARLGTFQRELKSEKKTPNKNLYLIKIRSRIDDKNYIKIGLTSKGNIEDRFNEDEVVDLIEVYRFVNLGPIIPTILEYNLIKKYRPKGYFAERQFDKLSRFDGYTEVVQMKNLKKIIKDIDLAADNQKKITGILKSILRLNKDKIEN